VASSGWLSLESDGSSAWGRSTCLQLVKVAPARTRADQVRCVDGAPAVLGGLDELERHGQPGGAAAGSAGDQRGCAGRWRRGTRWGSSSGARCYMVPVDHVASVVLELLLARLVYRRRARAGHGTKADPEERRGCALPVGEGRPAVAAAQRSGVRRIGAVRPGRRSKGGSRRPARGRPNGPRQAPATPETDRASPSPDPLPMSGATRPSGRCGVAGGACRCCRRARCPRAGR